MFGRSIRSLLVLALAPAVLAATLVALASSPAAAGTMVGRTEITGVVVQPTKNRIKISYKNDIDLPGGARVNVRVYPEATLRAQLSSGSLSIKKGKHVTYVSTKSLIQVLRIRMTVDRLAPVDFIRLARPSSTTVARVVSRSDAVANAVAPHVAGAILTIVPQTRVVKVAGALILGWTVGSDVKKSLKGSGGTCPKLAAGQYIRTTSSYAQSGKKVKQTIRYQVWHSKKRYTNGKSPACTVVTTHTFG